MSTTDWQITRLLFRLQDPIYCTDNDWLIFVSKQLDNWTTQHPDESLNFFTNYLKWSEGWELIRKNPGYTLQSLEIIKNKFIEIKEANNKIGGYLGDKYYG